jgi:hypothetical protein
MFIARVLKPVVQDLEVVKNLGEEELEVKKLEDESLEELENKILKCNIKILYLGNLQII